MSIIQGMNDVLFNDPISGKQPALLHQRGGAQKADTYYWRYWYMAGFSSIFLTAGEVSARPVGVRLDSVGLQ